MNECGPNEIRVGIKCSFFREFNGYYSIGFAASCPCKHPSNHLAQPLCLRPRCLRPLRLSVFARKKKHLVQTLRLRPRRLCVFVRKKITLPSSALAPSATLRLCEKKNHPSKLCALASLREKKTPVQTLRLRPLRLSVFARKKNTRPNSALAPSAP
jgi:hypothetical protein